jgi:hypothetical protein
VDIETLWRNVTRYEGEEFFTKTGTSFYYTIKGNVLNPTHTERNIPKSNFEKALTRLPLVKTTQLNDLQGYAYIYGILTDKRIMP